MDTSINRLSERIIVDGDVDKVKMTEEGIKNSSKIMKHMTDLKLTNEQFNCILNCSCDGNYGEFKDNILRLNYASARICEKCDCKWDAIEMLRDELCNKKGCTKEGKLYCSVCYTSLYCSKNCQKMDWNTTGCHKNVCADNKIKIMGAVMHNDVYVRDIISERGIMLFMRRYGIVQQEQEQDQEY